MNFRLLNKQAELISKKYNKTESYDNDESVPELENEEIMRHDTLSMINIILKPEFSIKPEEQNEINKRKSGEQFIPNCDSHTTCEKIQPNYIFEKVKSFENYFPAGNIEEIILQIDSLKFMKRPKPEIDFGNLLHSEKILESYYRLNQAPNNEHSPSIGMDTLQEKS